MNGSLRVLLVVAAMCAISACGDSGTTEDVDGGGRDGGQIRDATLDSGSDDAGSPLDAEIDGGLGGAPDSSVAIAQVRAAVAGELSPAIRLVGVLVTYVAPAIGADPAGFFVQSSASGPALFVAIDPSTLSPAPEPGDRVTFDVTEVVDAQGRRHVAALETYARLETGVELDPWIQDVGVLDLVAELPTLDGELVELDATISTAFSTCVAPHRCAQIVTSGVATPSGALRFRTTEAIEHATGMRNGCRIAIGPTPLWRFNDSAQPSASRTEDVSVEECPAFGATSASAADGSTVLVTFDAVLDPDTVSAARFTISGLTVNSASVERNVVTLTTGAITPGMTYTVVVADQVSDLAGSDLDPARDEVSFTAAGGCTSATHLLISEFDANDMGADDQEFIELYNPTSSAIDLSSYVVIAVNGGVQAETARVALSGLLPAGGYAVVRTTASSMLPTLPEGVLSFELRSALQNEDEAILLLGPGGEVIDGVAYGAAVPTITLADDTMVTPPDTASGTARDEATGSLARIDARCDSNSAADWAVFEPTPGAPNG